MSNTNGFPSPVFVYAKAGQVRCFWIWETAEIAQLQQIGWVHTATLNVPVWVEALVNKGNIEEMIEELKSGVKA
jgi:hypothetical protein